jgi:hypothetical protein
MYVSENNKIVGKIDTLINLTKVVPFYVQEEYSYYREKQLRRNYVE